MAKFMQLRMCRLCVSGWVRGKNIWIVSSSRAQHRYTKNRVGFLEVVIQFGGLMGGPAASSFSPYGI
jgi:hypothetical protein